MLLSGGVDSSVSMRLLQDAGHDLTAFYIKIWLEEELAFLGECPWEDDLKYARAVCDQAGIELRIVNFQKEYWQEVVATVISEARAGRTPNPDILCNSRIKFGMFYESFGQDFEKVATGHYAQIEERHAQQEFFLKKSQDPIKDQTYFLSRLSQAQVARALFPLGGYTKETVRVLAARYGLSNAARKDSQGICFLGTIAFDKFLEQYLGKKEGNIVDLETGDILGKHDGFWFYTIGQRRGLGLSGGPWYVADKNIEDNTVFVSNDWRSEEMARDVFVVNDLNWVSGSAPKEGSFSVKIRHGEKEYPCAITFLDEDRLEVRLKGFDRGIASGQSAVLYDNEYCLGGGLIM